MTVNSFTNLYSLYNMPSTSGGYATIQQGTQIANMASGLLAQIFASFGSDNSAEAPERERRVSREKEVDSAPKAETVKPEEAVKNALKNSGIDFDNESAQFKSDILKKYNTMTTIAKSSGVELSDEEVSRRLTNYAKGWKFHEFGLKAKDGAEVADYESGASSAKTVDELKTSYQQFASEYVEFYDKDGNGSIDSFEMFYQELVDYYKSKEGGFMTDAEAHKKAIEAVENFKKDSSLVTGDTQEAVIFTDVMNKISLFDSSHTDSPDSVVSKDEAAAYLLSMAQSVDNKNAITGQEYFITEHDIAGDNKIIPDKMKAAYGFIN